MDDEVSGLISERLRSFRGRAGLSLERLSKLAGVSRGMLSQIEQGRSVPTVTVLSRIAGAFEVPVAAFLTSGSNKHAHVIRRGSGQELRSADGKYVSRALFPFEGERRSELFEIRLEPGCVQTSQSHTTGTTENLVVVEGTLTLEIAGERNELNAGDSIFFAADVPHTYRNDAAAVAVAHLVMSYAQTVNY